MIRSAIIAGTGSYVPDQVITNADLSKVVDTNDEWISSRTGIKERRILKGDGLAASDMGYEMVKGLLEKTNTKPEEIDLIDFLINHEEKAEDKIQENLDDKNTKEQHTD